MRYRDTSRSMPLRGVLLGALLLLAGCRTYGSHDSQRATYEALERATLAFEEDLARRRADLDVLTQAAGQHTALGALAEQYRAAVLVHDATLGEARAQLAGLGPSSTHRSLKRSYGAFLMKEQALQRQYDAILRGLTTQAPDSLSASQRYLDPQSRYFIVPPYYERLRAGTRAVSLEDALSGAAAAPAAPDTTGTGPAAAPPAG